MNLKICSLKFYLFKDKTKKAFRSESSNELVMIGCGSHVHCESLRLRKGREQIFSVGQNDSLTDTGILV